MTNDPREAYKAVKSSIYKRIIGGNVSDLNRRGAVTAMRLFRKQRKLDETPQQRGGNRRPVSDRTKQLDAYLGKDRGFVLRFLDAGADNRMTRYGNRGAIRSTRLFELSATMQMETAASNLSDILGDEIAEMYNQELNK